MSLTSEQAKELNNRPRITPEVEDEAISMYAEGATDVEVQSRFPTWAVGTFRNLRGRNKAEIDDLRRQRTVQFSDIAGTWKQARLDDHWQIRTAYMMLFRAHLESCYAVNPVTGETEFFEQLVDAKKLQMYSSEIRAVLADALDQNLAIGVRAAVADHLGRVPTRAELTAARRAARSLAGLSCPGDASNRCLTSARREAPVSLNGPGRVSATRLAFREQLLLGCFFCFLCSRIDRI